MTLNLFTLPDRTPGRGVPHICWFLFYHHCIEKLNGSCFLSMPEYMLNLVLLPRTTTADKHPSPRLFLSHDLMTRPFLDLAMLP